MGVDCDQALYLLADHGVRVDMAARRAYPGPGHIERALRTTPRSVAIYGRGCGQPVLLEGDRAHIMSGGSSLTVLTLEGLYEPATWEHLRRVNAVLDALSNIHVLINQIDPQDDAPDGGMYRRLAAEMLCGCRKPILLQAATADDVCRQVEMNAVIRGSREALAQKPIFMIGCNSGPSLNIPQKIAELVLGACDAGIPLSVGNYHTLEVTTPRSVAGGVVQLNAVQLTALVLAQCAKPGIGIPYTAFRGNADMRTLGSISSDPLALQQLRLATTMGRYYGLPVYGTALTDSRLPDGQAACEHSVQLQLALGWGVHLIQGSTSMMDAMMLSSFVQAIIGNDIAGYVLAARQQPEITAETLALDAIHEVTIDPSYAALKFAGHTHTVRHLRDERWRPLAFTYDSFATWQDSVGRTLVERATAVARQILARHRPPQLPEAQETEIRRIAAR